MNAADQRRLTPVLGVLCALCALLLAVLVLGLGRKVHWDVSVPAATLPAAASLARSAAPPLQRFVTSWQQPLFNADRKPAPETDSSGANVSLGNLQLSGIIITPDLRLALLHDRSGKGVQVHEGADIAGSGWTLFKLSPRSAIFSGNGQRTELKLEVAVSSNTHASAGTPNTDAARNVGNRAPTKPQATQAHVGALQMHPPADGRQAVADETGQREKQRRIAALKARIESRRRQLQTQQNQGH